MSWYEWKRGKYILYVFGEGQSPEEGHRCPLLAAKHSEPGRRDPASYRDPRGLGGAPVGSLLSPLRATPAPGTTGIDHVSRTANHEAGT